MSKKVKKNDTITIRVTVTRVSEDRAGEQVVTIVVGGQPHTVPLRALDVVG